MFRAVAGVLVCSLFACNNSHPAEGVVAGRGPSTRADCSACHEREYRSAPSHVAAKPTRCAVCHSETRWQPTQLSHTWPLIGAHAKADCSGCHKGSSPDFERTGSECSDCHRGERERAASHDALAAFSCSACHSSVSWLPATQSLPMTSAAQQPLAAEAAHTARVASAPAAAIRAAAPVPERAPRPPVSKRRATRQALRAAPGSAEPNVSGKATKTGQTSTAKGIPSRARQPSRPRPALPKPTPGTPSDPATGASSGAAGGPSSAAKPSAGTPPTKAQP